MNFTSTRNAGKQKQVDYRSSVQNYEVHTRHQHHGNQALRLLFQQGLKAEPQRFRSPEEAALPVKGSRQVLIEPQQVHSSENAIVPLNSTYYAALEQVRDKVLDQAFAANIELTFHGISPLFDEPRLYRAQDYNWEYDMWLVNMADDPWFQGIPWYRFWQGATSPPSAPRRVLEKLEFIQDRVDLEFQLYIAHEILPGRMPGNTKPRLELLLPPQSQRVQEESARLGNTSQMVWQALWQCASFPIKVISGIANAAVRRPKRSLPSYRPLLRRSDPIILGAVVAPGRPVQTGEPAAWFELAHWYLGDED